MFKPAKDAEHPVCAALVHGMGAAVLGMENGALNWIVLILPAELAAVV
jgi:hypothetical protein